MKRTANFNFVLASILMVFSFTLVAKAQERLPPPPMDGDNPPVQQPGRPNLMRELGLSPAQLRQVRRIMQERQPINRESKQRLQEANDALDQALYADKDSDAEIQTRFKEVHTAQMEVIKNRIDTERAVRQILTPAQLTRFRDLLAQYKQMNRAENKADNQLNKINTNQNKMINRPARLQLKRMGRRNAPRIAQ